MPLLSIQIWLPLVGAVLLLAASKAPAALARGIAWVTALLTFLVSVGIYLGFQQDSFHFQLVESHDWIPSLGIKYALGIDGISLWLVVLTSFIGLIAVGLSRYVTQQTHAFLALVLALESFMLGAFASLDLLLFFTFFELTLFPLYFLIVIWGGERRNFAGAKFFIYTFAGSIFMLIGMIAVAFRMPGGASFDLQQIQQVVSTGQLWQGNTTLETLVFWAFTVGFLIKSPSFPFHTWIADTYSESPAVVPLLSSVMAKLGTFGLLRFCLPLFPDVVAAQTPLLMGLAIAGIVYGGILATIQKDMRRVIAYSSVSHMGFILLGIFSLMYSGMVGAAYQQINHGIVAGGLIVLIGLLYERRKTNQLSEYGGLKAQMPMFATLFLILTLASVGLPGTNGFVGEFLSLLGSFEVSSHKLVPGLSLLYPVIAVSGVVLAAGYMLYMYQRLFYGKLTNPANRLLKDIKPWEAVMVGSLVVITLWGGIYPSTFLKPMEASLQATRMMASFPAGSRPQWSDLSQSIELHGATTSSEGALRSRGSMVAAGQLHFPFRPLNPSDKPGRRIVPPKNAGGPRGGVGMSAMPAARPPDAGEQQ